MEVKVINISKEYEGNKIFENFSMIIESGVITCIYGSSGCGKSTLINIIGLIEPYDGKIFYDNSEILKRNSKRKYLKNKIAFIFQDFGLIDNKSVLENLCISDTVKRKSRFELEKILLSVNLNNVMDKKVYQLSGGEKQRVSIARAIAKDADLILADEPTGSVDEENEALIMNIFRRLKKEGRTILIASHSRKIIEFSDVKIEL